MTRVAAIGECMIELSAQPDGTLTRAFGGDTLNTAVYLARLGITVDYLTALGDDAWSDAMLAFWASESVGTSRVVRVPGRLPGLYIIETDGKGERRFSYWRDRAPARDLFGLPETNELCAALGDYGLVYLSGISLSLYGVAGRARLLRALDLAKSQGTQVAFDTNFRPRGWPDPDEAKTAYAAAVARADIVFASVEDMQLLYAAAADATLDQWRGKTELVEKLAHPACRVKVGERIEVIAPPAITSVVDTTAAGDSFAAAYLAARLGGADAPTAVHAGHRLAGRVVQHRGAIIPRAAMPS